MTEQSDALRERITNAVSFQATCNFIGAWRAMEQDGVPTSHAVTIVVDAALMTAASLLKTAVGNGVVGTTQPIPQVLHQRLDELLAMETRIHPERVDGSFDPVGQTVQ